MFHILLLFSSILSVFGETPVVETTHGRVTGKVLTTLYENNEYYGYMGIPYAKPPLGDLRFLPPQDLNPWEDTLSATSEKPACIQFNTNIKKKQPLGRYGTEDCLYLDVFTPSPDRKKRAVIVFIHNEHMHNSYNKSKDYAHDFFIEGDVVMVTASHRLGVLGFLSFEDEILPGNAGLLDLYAALEWISANVERFGGDPERVTLMGSQGGAAAVDLLIRSRAKELFKSAILQSGTSFASKYLQESARERALRLGELLNIPSSRSEKLLHELREYSVPEYFKLELRAMPDNFNRDHQMSLLPFGPIVENRPSGLITKYPEQTHEEYDIPVMIGFNSREGIELSLQYLLQPNFVGSLTKYFPLIMPMRVDLRFDPLDKSYGEAVEEIKKFYFTKKKFSHKSIPEFITYIGDVINAYAINAMVDNFAKKNTVYYYYFDYYSNLNENKDNMLEMSQINDGTWGAATGDELCYLFKCPDLTEKYLGHREQKSEEWIVQKKLIRMWTNFAKYGNPTPPNENHLDIEWPKYDETTKKYLRFSNKVEIKENLLSERFEFWDNFIKKWKERSVNGVVRLENKKDEL